MMLQSIQYGGGMPLYVHGGTKSTVSDGVFHVYGSQMTGNDPERKKKEMQSAPKKREKTNEEKERYLRDSYERGYKGQELLKWN